MSVMAVHSKLSIGEMKENVFAPADLTQYFQTHDSLAVPARTTYTIKTPNHEIEWQENDTTNGRLMKLALDEMLSAIGKQCRVKTDASQLLLTTYKDGFALMSLEGFVIQCQPIKV